MNSATPFAPRDAKRMGYIAGGPWFTVCRCVVTGVAWLAAHFAFGQGVGSWQSTDVGGPAPAGSSADAGGSVSVRGGGADIWDTVDQYHFRYVAMSENGELVARFTGLTNTDPWAKAGLMFRSSLEPGSPNLMLFATPGGQVFYQRRFANNGLTELQSVTYASAPVWLRLVRRNTVVTAYYSHDGANWLGGVAQDFGSNIFFVGLAVTSHRPGMLCTATFDGVQVLPSSSSPPPTAPSGLFIGVTSSSSLSLRWNDNSTDETAFLVERSTDGIAFVLRATLSENAVNFTDTGLPSDTPYYYRVRASRAGVMSAYSNVVAGRTLSGSSGPTTWENEDVGGVAAAGSFSEPFNGPITLRGSGRDVWETSDEFHFRYRMIGGDCEITAHVTAIDQTDPMAKAGVMMRAGLGASAANVFVAFNPSFTAMFQHRASEGATSSIGGSSWLWPDTSVHIVRRGNVFTARANGQLLGSVTIDMPAEIAVGLAVTSHNDGQLCSATFEDMRLYVIRDAAAVSTPTDLAAAGVASNRIELRWDYVPTRSTFFEVQRSNDGINFHTIGSTEGNMRYADHGVSPADYTFYYRVRTRTLEGPATSAYTNIVSARTLPGDPPPATPTQLTATTLSSTEIRLTWIDNASDEDYLRIVRWRSGQLDHAITLPPNSTAHTDTNLLPGTDYSYVVFAGRSNGNGSPYSTSASATTLPDSGPVPSWDSADVGGPNPAGGSSASGGALVVSGAGEDVWNQRDEFHFYSRTFTGDGEVSVRIDSLDNTDAWAKAGVMMRNGTSDTAANVFLCVTPQSHLVLQVRAESGGSSRIETMHAIALPVQVKLVRRGNNFDAHYSYNGTNWTYIGFVPVVMPGAIRAGLAVTSHREGILCSARFDLLNVLGGGGTGSDPSSVAAPSNLTATVNSSNMVQLQWVDNSSNETGFQLERSADGVNFSVLSTPPANLTSHGDNSGTVGVTYRYRVRAVGASSTFSNYSNVVTVTLGEVSGNWMAASIGNSGRTDTGWREENGAMVVDASGEDIWSTADGFLFVNKQFSGDGRITARVMSLENTHAWAKAGVMIRESLAAGARHAFLCLTPANGAIFHARTASNGPTSLVEAGWWASAPYWVRLERAGNTFTASTSADGVTWSVAATETITMGAAVHLGLAVTAHDTTQLNTAVFSAVQIE